MQDTPVPSFFAALTRNRASCIFGTSKIGLLPVESHSRCPALTCGATPCLSAQERDALFTDARLRTL